MGLLGTAFTMEQDFYRGRLEREHGLEVLVPEAEDRAAVHAIIYRELVAGRVLDAEQFNDIAIVSRGAYVVKLRDIGHAEDSTEEPVTAARLNAQPSVTDTVLKQSGTNTV